MCKINCWLIFNKSRLKFDICDYLLFVNMSETTGIVLDYIIFHTKINNFLKENKKHAIIYIYIYLKVIKNVFFIQTKIRPNHKYEMLQINNVNILKVNEI